MSLEIAEKLLKEIAEETDLEKRASLKRMLDEEILTHRENLRLKRELEDKNTRLAILENLE